MELFNVDWCNLHFSEKMIIMDITQNYINHNNSIFILFIINFKYFLYKNFIYIYKNNKENRKYELEQ